MSTATSAAPAGSTSDGPRTRGTAAPGTPAVTPVRTRRSGIWLAAAIVVILLGALAGVFLWTTASNTQQVFVTSHAIERGATIERGDLATIALAAGQSTQAIPVSRADDVIGKIAADSIAAGGLITNADLTTALAVPSGKALVGIELKSGRLPAQTLVAGDKVIIVPVATQSATGTTSTVDPSATIPATVSQVTTPSTNSGSTSVIVDVYVDVRDAASVTSQAAAGAVAIYLAPEN